MLKLFSLVINILLIAIIFLRIPKDNIGIGSFATKTSILDSFSSSQRSLDIVTAVGILIYFGIAIQLNLANNL